MTTATEVKLTRVEKTGERSIYRSADERFTVVATSGDWTVIDLQRWEYHRNYKGHWEIANVEHGGGWFTTLDQARERIAVIMTPDYYSDRTFATKEEAMAGLRDYRAKQRRLHDEFEAHKRIPTPGPLTVQQAIDPRYAYRVNAQHRTGLAQFETVGDARLFAVAGEMLTAARDFLALALQANCLPAEALEAATTLRSVIARAQIEAK